MLKPRCSTEHPYFEEEKCTFGILNGSSNVVSSAGFQIDLCKIQM